MEVCDSIMMYSPLVQNSNAYVKACDAQRQPGHSLAVGPLVGHQVGVPEEGAVRAPAWGR